MSLGEDLVRALDREASQAGRSRSELIERTLARELAGAQLEHIWSASAGPRLTDDEATELAYSELRAVRAERKARRAS